MLRWWPESEINWGSCPLCTISKSHAQKCSSTSRTDCFFLDCSFQTLIDGSPLENEMKFYPSLRIWIFSCPRWQFSTLETSWYCPWSKVKKERFRQLIPSMAETILLPSLLKLIWIRQGLRQRADVDKEDYCQGVKYNSCQWYSATCWDLCWG